MLSNAYFLAKFRFDTGENEPAKNLQNFANLRPRGAARQGGAYPRLERPGGDRRPAPGRRRARGGLGEASLAFRSRRKARTYVCPNSKSERIFF